MKEVALVGNYISKPFMQSKQHSNYQDLVLGILKKKEV
jgi:hypothetical protein